jgi:hypothetical protein
MSRNAQQQSCSLKRARLVGSRHVWETSAEESNTCCLGNGLRPMAYHPGRSTLMPDQRSHTRKRLALGDPVGSSEGS